jgi:hypothetical protein
VDAGLVFFSLSTEQKIQDMRAKLFPNVRVAPDRVTADDYRIAPRGFAR